MELPVIDLSHFTSGSEVQRAQFINGLVNSFNKTGFVKLVNHGFTEQRIQDLFGWSKAFFDQPIEAKNEVRNPPGPKPQRGYTGVGIESTSKLSKDEKIRAMADAKEHFDQGPAEDGEFPNRWPTQPELTGFRPFMEDAYRQCDWICLELMRALEVGLHVPDGSLVERCIPSATDLRLNHYPPIQIKEMRSGHTSRISPHTDFGIVTLLLQDGVGGLEIEDRGQPGTFLPVPPSNVCEMIVNISDTLQRWTNDELTGGVHRVTIPLSLKDEGEGAVVPERFTMAYFFKAERQVMVGPLPSFVTPDKPQKYEDITALEFQQWRNNMMYAY